MDGAKVDNVVVACLPCALRNSVRALRVGLPGCLWVGQREVFEKNKSGEKATARASYALRIFFYFFLFSFFFFLHSLFRCMHGCKKGQERLALWLYLYQKKCV